MKKNILVIQSLLVLPLITCSLILAMEKPSHMQRQQMKKLTPRQRKEKKLHQQQVQKKLAYNQVAQNALQGQEKENYLQKKEHQAKQAGSNLIKELEASFSHLKINKTLASTTNTQSLKTIPHQINITSTETKTTDDMDNINYDEFPFGEYSSSSASTSSSLAATSSESSSTITESSILASVILPTEKKGLGVMGNISYYTSRNSLLTFITYLIKGTFEIENADFFEWFNQAIAQGAENKAFNSLMTIAALCQKKEEYKNSIRISDDAAQKSFNFFENHYTTEVSNLNKALEAKQKNSIVQYNQKTIAFAKFITESINNYNKDIQNIADDYAAETKKAADDIILTKQQLTTFSALNKSTRNKITDLIDQPSLTIPGNECNNHLINERIFLEKLLKTTNKLTTIVEPEHKLQNSLGSVEFLKR